MSKGTTDISNSGVYAQVHRPKRGFFVLAAGGAAQALSSDTSQRFQKIWIYPGTDNGDGTIKANAAAVTVGLRGTLIDGSTEEDVVTDALNPGDFPVKYELPLGMCMQLMDVILKGTAGDGVFFTFWG